MQGGGGGGVGHWGADEEEGILVGTHGVEANTHGVEAN